MRGKLSELFRVNRDTGITPADAGKTICAHGTSRNAEDHPRGCGENLHPASATRMVKGSPPRMRGKLITMQYGSRSERITPADAGKTKPTHRAAHFFQDHPRGCGENYAASWDVNRWCGSPPRMRGKPSNVTAFDGQPRITPADAGKTTFILPPVSRVQDHPRGCGENVP